MPSSLSRAVVGWGPKWSSLLGWWRWGERETERDRDPGVSESAKQPPALCCEARAWAGSPGRVPSTWPVTGMLSPRVSQGGLLGAGPAWGGRLLLPTFRSLACGVSSGSRPGGPAAKYKACHFGDSPAR